MFLASSTAALLRLKEAIFGHCYFRCLSMMLARTLYQLRISALKLEVISENYLCDQGLNTPLLLKVVAQADAHGSKGNHAVSTFITRLCEKSRQQNLMLCQ